MDLRNLETILEMVTPIRFDWIQVEVSADCNAACIYCPRNCYQDNWDGGLMTMRTFERLAPNFRWADLVFLQGWGEPLLHPHLWNMVRKVKSSGAKVGFTTSATSLADNHIEHLLEGDVDIVGVSLAGTSPATHETLRRGCDFRSIDSTLRKIRQLKKARGLKKPGIHLAVVLLQSNWREMAHLPALADSWGVEQVVVSHLGFIVTEAMEKESLLEFPEMWPEIETVMDGVRKEAEVRGIEFHYYKPALERPCAICTENVLNACFVSHSGDVSPCVMTAIPVKSDKTVHHWFQHKPHSYEDYIFGNIHDRPLREIWRSDRAREFRRLFKDRQKMKNPGLESLPALCEHCYKLMEQ